MQDMATQTAIEIFLANASGLMKDRGWTQAELARRAGTSKQSLGRVMRGEEGLTLERAEKIAAAFSLPLSAMIASELPQAEQVA